MERGKLILLTCPLFFIRTRKEPYDFSRGGSEEGD